MEGPTSAAREVAPREKEWVACARRGDAFAFEQLYLCYRDRVYTLCLSLCGDREEAQDLLQETFVRAYRALAHFRGDSQFLTWVHRIAINLFRDAVRKRARAPVAPPPRPPTDEVADDVRSALAHLQPQHRLVLALRYSQTLSYQEIADLLGWSLARVKVTIHRAKRAFKDVYQVESHHAVS